MCLGYVFIKTRKTTNQRKMLYDRPMAIGSPNVFHHFTDLKVTWAQKFVPLVFIFVIFSTLICLHRELIPSLTSKVLALLFLYSDWLKVMETCFSPSQKVCLSCIQFGWKLSRRSGAERSIDGWRLKIKMKWKVKLELWFVLKSSLFKRRTDWRIAFWLFFKFLIWETQKNFGW